MVAKPDKLEPLFIHIGKVEEFVCRVTRGYSETGLFRVTYKSTSEATLTIGTASLDYLNFFVCKIR